MAFSSAAEPVDNKLNQLFSDLSSCVLKVAAKYGIFAAKFVQRCISQWIGYLSGVKTFNAIDVTDQNLYCFNIQTDSDLVAVSFRALNKKGQRG